MTDTDAILAELDPTPADDIKWPVSRRRVLQGLASVGALSAAPGAASGQEAAGTAIAEEAFFSNYGATSTAAGWDLTIDGKTISFDGTGEIELDDGTIATEWLLPDGASASEIVAPDGSVVYDQNDGAAVRPDDEGTFGVSDKRGLELNIKTSASGLKAQISNMTQDQQTAYLVDESDDSQIASKDVSGLTAGDIFNISASLSTTSDYILLMDANGSNYTDGYFGSTNYPYTGDDVDITAGIFSRDSVTTNKAYNIKWVDIL